MDKLTSLKTGKGLRNDILSPPDLVSSTTTFSTELLSSALNQPFHRFSEGLQARAYKSECGNLVLKLFKSFEESLEQWVAWGKDPTTFTKEWHDNNSASCRLAFKKLREETGIRYLHLDNEDLPLNAVLINGSLHDLQDKEFLLQDRVELFRDKFARLVSTGFTAQASRSLEAVMEYIEILWRKNITEDTFNFDHNYGFKSDGTLIQIDVGSFFEGREYIMREVEARRLLTNQSYSWLAKSYPEFLPHFKEQANALYTRFLRV